MYGSEHPTKWLSHFVGLKPLLGLFLSVFSFVRIQNQKMICVANHLLVLMLELLNDAAHRFINIFAAIKSGNAEVTFPCGSEA